ncbi:MAG: CoA transferase [Proteobacteria bacterium]|nr:CoA transferase [Pseudomonadota bacterium]
MSTDLPLAGLRVLDMADEKGELCGRLLSDLGARVIRLEPPEGAGSRRLPPFTPDGQHSLYFAVRNAGKLGITLDWTREEQDDRSRLHQLLEQTDIWIESLPPGTLAAHGMDPATVLERHPALVLTSITDFGQTGPYRDYRGTDMIGFAMGGLMHRAGAAERPPVVAPGALAYDAAGITAGFATLLAYWKRLRTGRGQHVDVSVHESVANLSDWSLPNFSASDRGAVGGRAGAGIFPIYRCADGFVRMIILVEHHWQALLQWMGEPDELKDPSLRQFVMRLMKRDVIDPVVEAFFGKMKKIDAADEAQRRGIPATPVLTPSEVLSNEHVVARGTFCSLEIAPGLEAQVASGLYELDGKRAGPRRRPPELGEHNDEVFAGLGSSAGASTASDPPPTRAAATRDDRPFRGLRVIDFGIGAVGVEVGRLFAEYGADVVKIESHRGPDFMRVVLAGWINPSFASSSRSKRSLGVNLKTARGVELVCQLVKGADVVIENSATGVLERLGLGYARLSELNPRLVMLSSQMVGSRGPWGHWVGYGPSTHPVSGMQYLWNYPEDAEQPAGSTNVHPDHLVGRVGALGCVACLIGRERTGRGRYVEAAQFETAIQLMAELFAQESLAPGSVRPLGNASSRGVPWGAYPCAGEDEWCAINVRDDGEWDGLCAAMGRPAWAKAAGVATAEGRQRASGEIDTQLGRWTSERSPREVMETLQACGVPAGMLAHGRHQLEDPHLAARGYLVPVEQPGVGSLIFEGPAFHGSDLEAPIVRPAPLLGQHTREVCAELLGLSDAEIDALVAEGVLEDGPPDS